MDEHTHIVREQGEWKAFSFQPDARDLSIGKGTYGFIRLRRNEKNENTTIPASAGEGGQ